MLAKQVGPSWILPQIRRLTDDDQAVLGASYGHVYAIVLFDEVAWLGAHHRYKNYVKLATLRAVD